MATPDREALARQRIAEEAEHQTGFLDLSGLELAGLPNELFALRHLRRLHLGSGEEWVFDESGGPRNEIAADLNRLSGLPELEALSISGTDCESLEPLEALSGLIWLDFSNLNVT